MPTPLTFIESDFQPTRADEVARILNRKIPLTSSAFDLLKAEQRARAFRIAGVNDAALIQRVQNEISKALRDGTSFRDLRMRILTQFEDAGVDAPSLNHLRVVIRQNMATVEAVARDRMLRNPAVLEQFPYWQYVTVRDAGVRPTHAALEGLVFRADDPFWDTYDPPWEWNCRCGKLPVSEAHLARLGVDLTTLADVQALGIEPNPDFAFPRDQLKEIDEDTLRGFEGDLRRFLVERFQRADAMELAAIREIQPPVLPPLGYWEWRRGRAAKRKVKKPNK